MSSLRSKTPTFSGKTIPECLDYLLNEANTYQEFFGVEFRDCVYCDAEYLSYRGGFEDNSAFFMGKTSEQLEGLAGLGLPGAQEMYDKIESVYEKWANMIELMDAEDVDWSAYMVEHVDNYRQSYLDAYCELREDRDE